MVMWWTRLRDRLPALPGLVRPRRGRRVPRLPVRISLPGRRAPMRLVYDRAVVHESSSLRSRALQRAMRLLVKPLLHVAPLNDRTLRTLRSIDGLSARRPRSHHVEPVRFDLGGVRVESMTHRYGPSSDMTVLYFHGGGFMSCGIETHRRACERLALYCGGSVISVDYVQLPEGSVADSVQDAITAYEALLDMVEHPDKIVVAGDSAGGYLTMKVAELARRRGLQAPAALLGFSPLLSLDPERVDKGVVRVSRMRDAYIPLRRFARIRALWTPLGSTIEGCDSPLDATDRIASPTFLVAVEDEALRPEVEAFSLLLSEHGVEVETHLWRGQIHAFPVLADVMPESREALRLAADFARVAVGELDRPEHVDSDAHEEPLVGELVDDEVPVDAEEVIDADVDSVLDDGSRRRWSFLAG